MPQSGAAKRKNGRRAAAASVRRRRTTLLLFRALPFSRPFCCVFSLSLLAGGRAAARSSSRWRGKRENKGAKGWNRAREKGIEASERATPSPSTPFFFDLLLFFFFFSLPPTPSSSSRSQTKQRRRQRKNSHSKIGPPGRGPGGAEGGRLLLPAGQVGPGRRGRASHRAGGVLVRGDREGGDADVHAAREELIGDEIFSFSFRYREREAGPRVRQRKKEKKRKEKRKRVFFGGVFSVLLFLLLHSLSSNRANPGREGC